MQAGPGTEECNDRPLILSAALLPLLLILLLVGGYYCMGLMRLHALLDACSSEGFTGRGHDVVSTIGTIPNDNGCTPYVCAPDSM